MKYTPRKMHLSVVALIFCGPHLRKIKSLPQKIGTPSLNSFYEEYSSIRNFVLKANFLSVCIAKLVLGCLLMVGLVGCVSTTYVPHQQYVLDVSAASVKKNALKKSCYIALNQVEVLAPFDRSDFLYRVSSDRYLLDYYHGFLVSPAEQVSQILETYLNSNASFSVAASGVTKPQNNLQIKLVELYADYRDRNNPLGVLTLRFILTKFVDDKNVVVWDQIFTQRLTLSAKNTNSLLKAWNVGLGNILSKATKILNRKVGC